MGVMYKLMKHKHSSLDMKNVLEQRGETEVQDKKITAEHILQLCKFLAEKSKRNLQKQTVKQLKHLEYAKVSALEFDEVVEEMDIDVKVEETALPLIKHNRLDRISSSSTTRTKITNTDTITRTTVKRTTTASTSTKQILKPKTVYEINNRSSSSSKNSNYSSHHLSSERTATPPLSSPTIASCSMQYQYQHQQQQQDSNKKDILQKIRSQIMERKRLRQLALGMQQEVVGNPCSVWRPW